MKRKNLPLYSIIILAFLVRVLWIFSGQPLTLESDDVNYVNSARILWEQGTLTYNSSGPTAFITPGYPMFLAAILGPMGFTDTAMLIVRIFQAFLGAIALKALADIVTALNGGLLTQRISLIITALYLPLIMLPSYTITENLFVPSLLFFIRSILLSKDNPSGKTWAFNGFWLGITTLIRPTAALLLIVVWLFLTLVHRKSILSRDWVKSGLLFSLVFFLVLTPWITRNYIQFHTFIPLSTGSGNPLLFGTYYDTSTIVNGWDPDWPIGKTEIETNRLQTQLAVYRIINGFRYDFGTYFHWYAWTKFWILWFEPFFWWPLGSVESWTKSIHGFIASVAFVQIPFLLRKGLRSPWILVIGVIFYFSLVHQVYHSYARYALPLMPLIFILFGWGSSSLLEFLRELKTNKKVAS